MREVIETLIDEMEQTQRRIFDPDITESEFQHMKDQLLKNILKTLRSLRDELNVELCSTSQ